MKSYLLTTYLSCWITTSFAQICTPDSVTDTRLNPFKYVCYIQKFEGNIAYTTTGFLIAPRVVLTSAHNVYHATSYNIAPAHNGQGVELIDTNRLLTYGMVKFNKTDSNTKYPTEFIYNQGERGRKKAKHFDYAVILLPNDTIYRRLNGFLNLGICDSVVSVGDSLTFIGYPGGIPDFNSKLFQRTNSGKLTGYYEDSAMISYGFGTRPGASGSPIIYKKDNKNIVAGIHGYGDKNDPCKNSAVKISNAVLDNIRRWTEGLF
jgi:V8-like Glu-specific endopeptidase